MRARAARFEVMLTAGAERDLEAIHDYVAECDGQANASRLLDALMVEAESLTHHPDRGSHPRELLSLGIKEYRQIFFKPYRLIYRVVGSRVIVHLIADGRRDMQPVLARRLLGA